MLDDLLAGVTVLGKKLKNNKQKLVYQVIPDIMRSLTDYFYCRQLVNASPGTPLFEIFVVKDSDEQYIMQVKSKYLLYITNHYSSILSRFILMIIDDQGAWLTQLLLSLA